MVSNKIVDCFIFYNELDLLEYRLNVLWDIVSFFVICEASTTFIGNSKEYYLENSRFDSYRSKIIQLKIDLPYLIPDISKNEQWLNELTQRNFLYNGVNYLYEKNKITDNDLIIINGGWHLSYFGDTKFIQNKIDNFSHQEINITEEEIKERMDKGIDISGNKSVLYNNVKIKDNNYLPPNICLLSSLFNFI